MLIQTLCLAACCVVQAKLEPAHAQNPVFKQVLERGLDAGGKTITLPAPRLVDGQTADAQREVLREIAGSERGADDLLRDSVTAPFIIRVQDEKVTGATVREANVWFVVYGELDKIDPLREAIRADQKEVEVANMWFQNRSLKADEIAAAGLKPANLGAGQSEWYVHVHARLLDRIDFEVTNRVTSSRSADSIVIASRTDPSFDKVEAFANGWKVVPGNRNSSAQADSPGKQPYAGGMSYAKISRLALKPDALLVEMHMAFVEPDPWFQGSPILRSKFSVAAQDQIRTLRRELMKKRRK